ncbi:Nitrilase/cyanide hydratase and apolipoprotein N-acyltransferase [Halanaerobium hydrogeniformans]|uniref:Nitrilase/cyanide hydratase and apolipoprotein N-acyltransferase n=1 Tax=Halanaerobium hydrogeniformans TaxID=656519 RepID=E4RP98_HALHG|nr:Nitrilase/cyanide hydratase and apolipoprotein N-acyltransferase [Halanaerobium hydrogeniformans]
MPKGVSKIKQRKLKLALVQLKCELGNLKYNKDKILEHLGNAKAEGADIVCLPELATTGYNLELMGNDIYDLSVGLDDDYLKYFCNFAKEQKINIILPLSLKEENGDIYNTALVINRQGEIIGRYDKAHLFLHEKRFYNSGESYHIFELEGVKFGIIICYDLGFPEAARKMALQGAKILFVPSAWRIQDIGIWDLNTRQRALENNLFLCGVNRVGSEEDLYLFGGSRVVNPHGQITASASQGNEEVLITEIDLEEVEKARDYYQYLFARRKDLDEDLS